MEKSKDEDVDIGIGSSDIEDEDGGAISDASVDDEDCTVVEL